MRQQNTFQFSKKRLLACKPDKRTSYFDSHPEVYGLYCEVGEGGSYRTFYWRQRIGGKQVRVRIGPYPDMPISEARTKCRQIAIARLDGSLATPDRFTQASTLGAVMERYRASNGATEFRSWKDRESAWRHLLEPRLATVQLQAINAARGEDMQASIASIRSNRTANFAIWLLGHLMRWVIRRGAIVTDPTAGLKQLPAVARDRGVGPREIADFLQAVDAMKPATPLIADAVLGALFTGARQGNVLAMSWEQIDSVDRTWRIPLTKSGRPHTIPIVEPVSALVSEGREASTSDWVFPARRGDGHLTQPKRNWQMICQEGEIEGLRFHDLRHTLATWMARSGATYPIIGAMLGHTPQGVTARYTHVDIETVRDYAERAVSGMVAS